MKMDLSQANNTLTFAGLRYCAKRNSVVDKNDQRVTLRPKTLEVFRILTENHGSVITREYLLNSVWANVVVTEDSLTKCIAELRKTLGPDARKNLKTIPKRGYLIAADSVGDEDQIRTAGSGTKAPHSRLNITIVAGFLALLGCILLIYSVMDAAHDEGEHNIAKALSDQIGPSLIVRVAASSESVPVDPDALFRELTLFLSRYKTIHLIGDGNSDYSLQALINGEKAEDTVVFVNLIENQSGTEIFSERIELFSSINDLAEIAARISALIASPATGAIGRNLLANGRRKPVEQLTRSECYSHGYDCTNCSGELDTVDTRAQACLANILAEDDKDVRAWALQSTIYAKQYQWSTNLGEPQRTHVKLRQEIAEKALAAANQAEQLSDGTDSAVYWGMAQAYLAACDIPKMRTAINRGLKINPADPGLLATFGNWLAYSGDWDNGASMIEQALALEPRHYKRWWLFGIAKRHYINGEYQDALDVFEEAFNDRNWLSHLQLAYTLPYLDRIEDAKIAAERLQYKFPGVTVEVALQLYKLFCFPDEYLARMKKGLQMAGLPERGDSSDITDIAMPMSQIVKLENWDVEYMDLGQGTPVVFVHGAMSDYRSWAHYQNPVSENYRYISYSRRYHGSQQWHDDGKFASVSQHAADLEQFIEHLDVGPVVLVTWSSGASTSTAFALNRPDLVKGIVIYEPTTLQLDEPEHPDYPQAQNERFSAGFKRIFDHLEAKQDELAIKAFMETVFEKKPGEFETELMWIRRVVLDNARTVPLSFSTNSDPDVVIDCEALADLRAPALVMFGELTNAIWQYRARRYVECAPDALLESIAGVNHAGPIRVPTEVFSRIDNFIQSL